MIVTVRSVLTPVPRVPSVGLISFCRLLLMYVFRSVHRDITKTLSRKDVRYASHLVLLVREVLLTALDVSSTTIFWITSATGTALLVNTSTTQ